MHKETLYLYFVSYTKINLKWIVDPNVKPKTSIKKIGETLCDLGLEKDFLNSTQKTGATIGKSR